MAREDQEEFSILYNTGGKPIKPIRRVEDVAEDVTMLRAKVKSLERQLAQGGFEPLPAMKAKPWPTQFVHQTQAVAAGQTETVFSFSGIRAGHVALLRYLGVKWFPNTSIIWNIDGVEVETITRVIGDPINSIANPYTFKIPYEITSNLQFVATNNDFSVPTRTFEVYADGEIVPLEYMRATPTKGVPKLA